MDSFNDRSEAMKRVNEIVEEWRAEHVKYVRFELPDMHGTSRSKIIPLDQVERYASKGLNMYGGTCTLDTASEVVGGTLYNEEINYADQLLTPDLSTAAVIPWEPTQGRFICSTRFYDGCLLSAAPRNLLGLVLDKFGELGYDAMIGLEYEFYLLTPDGDPLFGGLHIFNTIRNATFTPVIMDIMEAMPKIGVDMITANCEYAPSQFELNFGPGRGMAGADKAFTFKNGVKEMARRAGLNATFMTKPFADSAASGSHCHVSLVDRGTDLNAMYDPDDPEGMSDVLRYFVAGQLKHAPAMTALMAPTPNCYKRFVPHHFAPSNISWGVEDRTAMIRVKGGKDASKHIENRLPTAISNPYLVAAAALAAGYAGLVNKDLPPVPGPGVAEDDASLTPLPRTLEESLAALESDSVMRDILGDEFVTVFTTIKKYELERFRAHVTDWERDEYLEVH